MKTLASFTLLLSVALVSAAEPKGTPTTISGMKGTAPAAWVKEKPSNLLRSYQFKLPALVKDLADAELAVYPESTPKYESKFKEWKDTFLLPEDKTADDISKVSKLEVNGNMVHVLDVNGTWKYRERPRDPSSKEMLKADYRVVWYVLMGKEETTHIRLSGPKKVVDSHIASVEKWIKELK